MKRTEKRQRGVFTVYIALIMPVIMGMFGLGFDISRYLWVRTQLQNTADAAAFAGAGELNGTDGGRTSATTIAELYAQQNTVDGRYVADADIVENVAGRWDLDTGTFTTAGVSAAAANAIRVTVWRQNVPTFFARVLTDALAARTLSATAVAVSSGPGRVDCTAPFVIASCAIQHDADGNMICPSSLSFQNGLQSAGLTLPDGTSPVNGRRATSYVEDVVDDPDGCPYPSDVGDTLSVHSGNDLAGSSVDDINAATNDGSNPITISMAVLDLDCGNSGPNYNGSADITGYVKMEVVGARFTGSAPAKVEAACPGLAKKNVCMVGTCTPLTVTQAGGTSQTGDIDSQLVK